MTAVHRQRDTPTRSPFVSRTPQPRSPKKLPRDEVGLHLERVIGTTCQSSTRFDFDPASNTFAYAAGAAVVVASVDNDLEVSQRFFRANAAQIVARPASSNGPSTPSAVTQEMRTRMGHRTREGSPFANHVASDNMDSPGASGHAKDRVKAATAVALSPGAKWLAVGETGYRPRVLVFPITDKRSTDFPSAIISEHSFGVHAVAFDRQGSLLATLGTINDGFLFIWEVDARTGATNLLASNKCTTLVKQMAWVGRSLITVGVRFIKVWRPDEVSPSSGVDKEHMNGLSHPGHKPLAGRNTLLGDMIEATFTAVVPLSDHQAIICSDGGDVCLLDDSGKQQKLTRLLVETFSITAACLGAEGEIIITGTNGQTKSVKIDSSIRSDTPMARPNTPIARKLDAKKDTYPVAIGHFKGTTVSVDNNRAISLKHGFSSDTRAKKVVSHPQAILGVASLVPSAGHEARFATWSSDGAIIGWDAEGRPTFQMAVTLEQLDSAENMPNSLRTAAFFPGLSNVATGDRYGVLKIIDIATGQQRQEIRAHSNEISDIALSTVNGVLYLATASRDRHVQVFRWQDGNLGLSQTLDEHAGAVTKVAFVQDGRYLLSTSADRTIVVRERIEDGGEDMQVFTIVKTINLKSAPTAMTLAAEIDHVWVAAADRTINLVDYRMGQITTSHKTSDNDGGDAVTLTSLVELSSEGGTLMLAGLSSGDKSVRLYSEDGNLLGRDWGHTEGVTDIAVAGTLDGTGDATTYRIVTVAVDGTIFVWNAQARRPMVSALGADGDVLSPINGASPLARPPLRKVISHAEISRLRKSMLSQSDDSEPETPTELRSPAPDGARKRPSRLVVTQAPRLGPVTPRLHTPTDSLGSPRSPSPSRSTQFQGRSASRSPERSPIRRQSLADLRKAESPLTGPKVQRPGTSRARTSEACMSTASAHEVTGPEAATGSSDVDQEVTAMELISQIRKFKCGLETSNGPGKVQDEEELRGELESLVRLLASRSLPSAAGGGAELGCTKACAGEASERDTAVVLESVEERSELDLGR